MIFQKPEKDKQVSKLQEGGAVPAGTNPSQTPQQGGEDPVAKLVQLAQQALESQDCQMAMALAQEFMALVGGAGQEAQAAPQGEPVYRKGGTLLRRV